MSQTSLAAGPRTALQRWRLPLAVVGGMLAVAVVLAVAASSGRRGYLDAGAAEEQGSRALVTLLREQGVDVVEAGTTAEAAAAAGTGSTVLLTSPDLLLPAQAEQLVASGADLVLVRPLSSLPLLAPGVEAAAELVQAERSPGCAVPAAARAGPVRLGGIGYRGGADACYAEDDAGALVRTVGPAGGDVVVLADPAPLTNAGLDEDGAAALAMGLLGAHERLVWFRPSGLDLTGGGQSVTELLPRWVGPAVGAVVLAWLLLLGWRVRRLGPLVTEPLPVVVRAAETTEGRARLYRRAHARDTAGEALRDAAAARLSSRLGLPRADRAGVVAAVAARTGRPTAEVQALLDGPPPPDDAALVRLATDLDHLEDEVTRS